MKKFIALLCAALVLAACFPIGIYAEDNGMTVDADTKYTLAKSFEEAPQTFEAWIYVPVGYGRAGVIIGNYAGSTACVNFEITTNGRPRLYVVEYSTGEKVIHDVTFKADVRTGDLAHVAIVRDSANGKTLCYLNGELVGTIAGDFEITVDECENTHVFAGDRRGGNGQYFKGNIGEVVLYSDVRSAEEIKADMAGVDLSDSNLLAYYNTFGKVENEIPDGSGNGYDVICVKKWFTEKEPVTDYAYSFCVVGDTQVVTEKYPDKLSCIYDWILENKDEKKIEFVFGLGDITNKNTDVEWELAKSQIEKMNGVVPYTVVRGNHENSAQYNRYLATLDYMRTLEGFYENGKIDNAWRTFKVGNTDFLALMLDFGPSDSVLDWASGVIEAHPNHKVIITTHCYLFRDGTTLDAGDVVPPNPSGANDGKRNNGDQMWDKLVSKHENIFLVMSGHDPCDNVIATQVVGEKGNVVTQMLIDPQGVDSAEGGTGMITMLYFSKDGKTLTVENYSTVRDMYYMSTSQFTLELPEDFWVDEEPAESEEPKDTEPPADTETQKPDETDDMSVIGGADGPTAIVVAKSPFPMWIVAAAVAAAVGFAVGFVLGKKKK